MDRRKRLKPGRVFRRQKKQAGDKLSRAVTIKQELQQLINTVRNKYKDLRRSDDEMRSSMEVKARPFVEPLQKAVVDSIRSAMPTPIRTIKKEKIEKIAAENEDESELERTIDTSTQTETKTSLPEKYLNRLTDSQYKDRLDFTYGVRPDGTGGTVIGNSKVSFSSSKIYVKDNAFSATRGLLELLFMKVPNRLYFNQNDLLKYKEILLLTNAHRQSYSDEKSVNSNRGKKYTAVISPLFFPKSTASTETTDLVTGKGITLYNDNANTLVNRLRLLVMSRSAGHTGHDLEITQIIEALRSNKIVA